MEERVTLHDEFKKEGYSKEEQYFYKLNRELIEGRRARLDERRATRRAENETKAHWMRCPKCGSKMQNLDLFQIEMERCRHCHGVYMDQDELETLLETKQPKTFLDRLKRVFEPKEEVPRMF